MIVQLVVVALLAILVAYVILTPTEFEGFMEEFWKVMECAFWIIIAGIIVFFGLVVVVVIFATRD